MIEKKMIKIGVVIPEDTGNFQKDVEMVADSMGVIPVFCTGHFVKVLPTVRRILQENPDISGLIARSTTAEYLKKNFDLPVVGIDVSNFDFCNAISTLPDKNGDFIVVQYNDSPSKYDVENIAKVCGISLKTIFLDTEKESDVAGEVRKAGGKRVVSSVGIVTEPCRRAGLEVVALRFSRDVIEAVIRQMLNLIEAKCKDQQRTEQLLHVLNALSEGVLAVDRQGKIVMANKIFCELIEYPYPSFIGASLEDVRQEIPFVRILTEQKEEGIVEYKDKKYTVSIPESLTNNMVHSLWTIKSFASVQEKATYFRRKLAENGYQARYHFSDIVSVSPAMERLKERARQYAKTDCNILILGESGTGKEMMAQSIHNESEYKDGPFIAINCAALPENLLESELFGYEEGAFTGARKGGKEGLIELSNKGTLFLDEIGLMPLSIQVKLLRSLQERQIRRVGGTKVIPVENRIISATNDSLIDDVRKGLFREDLFYRLDVLNIHVPPLRERKGDIPFLVQTLLRRKNAARNRSLEIEEPLLSYLNKYSWPGNFRQLESFVERMMALSHGRYVEKDVLKMLMAELPEGEVITADVKTDNRRMGDARHDNEKNIYHVRGSLSDVEEQMIQQAYERCKGDIAAMVDLLDISRTTLWRKMKKMNLM